MKVCLTRLLSLEKQKVAIADSTETINIVIWQDHIEQVNLGHSYEFLNVTVRMFDGQITNNITQITSEQYKRLPKHQLPVKKKYL